MCKMQWGDRQLETRAVIEGLMGRRDSTSVELERTFRTLYARYHTPQAAESPEGKARIASDVRDYLLTQELPDYVLSAA